MTLLCLKRLNDKFEEEAKKLLAEGKTEKQAYDEDFRHKFFVPKNARWKRLADADEKLGEIINSMCSAIEAANKKTLEGALTNTKYNDKRKYPDDKLKQLVIHFNEPTLNSENMVNSDLFGDAYEYLLEKFADETKKKGGEFFTPREIVELLVDLVEPKEGMTVSDPTCGSGGMLIVSKKHLKIDPDDIVIEGQENNYGNLAMCKMNMVLHDIEDFTIEYGDVLSDPKLVDGGKLRQYHKVLANFPFSMDWNNSNASKDSFGRFRYGIPPAQDKADFAFIQHMLASLNEVGQAAIVCSQGVLFRGGVEQEIRKNMILGDKEKNLQGDVIEAVIALPINLFYGTGIPGCVLILNRKKPEKRKNKIIFIYAAKEFLEQKNRNKLRPQDVDHIVKCFKKFDDEDRYCHIADLEELKENEYNLNVPRYVDISEPEEEVDIQAIIDELKKLDKDREGLELKIKQDLTELGFKI